VLKDAAGGWPIALTTVLFQFVAKVDELEITAASVLVENTASSLILVHSPCFIIAHSGEEGVQGGPLFSLKPSFPAIGRKDTFVATLRPKRACEQNLFAHNSTPKLPPPPLDFCVSSTASPLLKSRFLVCL
jgi:hypothetical protein